MSVRSSQSARGMWRHELQGESICRGIWRHDLKGESICRGIWRHRLQGDTREDDFKGTVDDPDFTAMSTNRYG